MTEQIIDERTFPGYNKEGQRHLNNMSFIFLKRFSMSSGSLFLLLCLQSVCVRLAAAPESARYTDMMHHFSIVPPSNWAVNKTLIPHYAVFVEPSSPKQVEATTLGTYGEPVHKLTLEQYVKSTRQEVLKEQGLTIYEEKAFLLDGVKAHGWRMHVALTGHPAHENRQVFCVHNMQAVILTLTTMPETIKKYDSDFDRAIASFRWEANPTSAKK